MYRHRPTLRSGGGSTPPAANASAMKSTTLALTVALGGALLSPSSALAASAPDRGVAWEPRPLSKPLYGTKAPDEDPETQQHFVEGHDGTRLYVETWLPKKAGGRVPPKKIPTILIMTPYVKQGVEEYPAGGESPSFIQYMTARGYAVAQHHVRGTGESGGCLEQTGKNQWDDGARVVEYLGRDAPWSNGKVGMYGISYDAETQISTAGFGDRKRLKYLKAIIPAASVGSQYDWNFMDGVNWVGQPLFGNTGYLAGVSLYPGVIPAPQHYPEKMECQDEVMGESANISGDYTEYWKDRELRQGAPNVKAATLYVHGLRDFNVQDITAQGWFNRLPKSTPHKGLFGVWNHAFPALHTSVEPLWARADWYAMVVAWYDRYLKGLDTAVERWPDVQIQDSTGQWWELPEYPNTGGPMGHLGLSADGVLGASRPRGETSYTEQLAPDTTRQGEYAVFETRKLTAPLHVTGQPMLNLWVVSDKDDGHVTASLEVIDRDGQPLRHEGSRREYHATYGARSLQHLEPMRRGWFEQAESVPLEAGTPTRVILRFLPTDLVVPKGGSLRLTVSGGVRYAKGGFQPSGTGARITVLHDCDYPSRLRFRMPDPKARLLNVLETDEGSIEKPNFSKLKSNPARIGRRDARGLASQRVCGAPPRALPFQ